MIVEPVYGQALLIFGKGFEGSLIFFQVVSNTFINAGSPVFGKLLDGILSLFASNRQQLGKALTDVTKNARNAFPPPGGFKLLELWDPDKYQGMIHKRKFSASKW